MITLSLIIVAGFLIFASLFGNPNTREEKQKQMLREEEANEKRDKERFRMWKEEFDAWQESLKKYEASLDPELLAAWEAEDEAERKLERKARERECLRRERSRCPDLNRRLREKFKNEFETAIKKD